MPATARSIVTEVLSVGEDIGNPVLPVRTLIDSCALFGFSANTVRVTLVKMRADGALESPERGMYRLGPASRERAERHGTEERAQADETRSHDRQHRGYDVHHRVLLQQHRRSVGPGSYQKRERITSNRRS